MNPRRARFRKRGVAAVVGAIILFGMLFTVAFSYFYFVNQGMKQYQTAAAAINNAITQQALEHFIVYGTLSGNQLAFTVNNTGITITIIAYWILNASSKAVIKYENTTLLPKSLPYSIGQGQSMGFQNTGVTVLNNQQQYVIKIITSRGTIGVGTYPSALLSTTSINSLVSAGLGSLQMTFSSFSWYDYISGPSAQGPGGNYNQLCSTGANCAGGNWLLDIKHPHSGSLVPAGSGSNAIPVVFSVNITNDDPSLGNIAINSESNLWVVQTCDSGTIEGDCPNSSPVFVFYIMNVLSNGTIINTSQGTFAQITIPLGTSRTLYYGAAYDMMLNSFSPLTLTNFGNSNPYYYGQFAVFLLFAGTKITPSSNLVYGQNIPFESTLTADNLGWYTQTPTSCGSGTVVNFNLGVNNSIFSPNKINKIVVNASGFTSISATKPASGWNSPTINSGIITWTASGGGGGGTSPGGYQAFSWTGTAPTVTSQTQVIFPLALYWNGGSVTVEQAAASCYVS